MKKFNSKIVVFAGVLIAMNLVLERVLALNIGNTLRVSFGATPIYLSSLWFGPVVGGVCGALADLVGCLLQGYALNPFIITSNILIGVLPALLKKYVYNDRMNLWKIGSAVALNGIIGSLGLTTVGLHVFYGTPWSVLYATRIVQTIGLVIANSLMVSLLYQSPITNLVTKSCLTQRVSR